MYVEQMEASIQRALCPPIWTSDDQMARHVSWILVVECAVIVETLLNQLAPDQSRVRSGKGRRLVERNGGQWARMRVSICTGMDVMCVGAAGRPCACPENAHVGERVGVRDQRRLKAGGEGGALQIEQDGV